jgi:hypothetical protein
MYGCEILLLAITEEAMRTSENKLLNNISRVNK